MPRNPKHHIHEGDCLDCLKQVADAYVDLAYLDPPFFTQKIHRLSPRDRTKDFSFEDIWSSQRDYAEFLYKRIAETHRVISPRGSIFVHCDRNAVHVLRLLLDDIFGQENFRSEIIWHYRRWSNSKRGLLPSHQTILYYSKSADYLFNEMLTEYSPSTNVDQILQRRSRDEFNKSVYDRDENGEIIPGGQKRGVPLGDVWDIPLLNPKAKERTGYPTQKPLLLLERIIQLATEPDSWVLDPFCGSGTTLVAAQQLGRPSIGIDVSPEAVALTKQRLKEPIRSSSRLHEIGREAYRNADERALSILQGLDYVPVHRNAGIDAIWKRTFEGGPVTIRVQRKGESVVEAARKLFKASAGKAAKLMFVVVTSRGGHLGFEEDLPEGVIAIDSVASSIKEALDAVIVDSRNS